MIVHSVTLGGLAVLFGVVAFGAVVPVVPTGAAVSGAAVLAGHHHVLEVLVVVGVGALGAYVGDVITYSALLALGQPLAHKVGWLHADDPDGHLASLRTSIEEHELRTLLVSRLVPGGRVPVLLVAALTGYPRTRFVSAAAIAATLWSVVYAFVGIAGSAVFDSQRVALVVAVAAAFGLGALLQGVKALRGRRSRAASGVQV